MPHAQVQPDTAASGLLGHHRRYRCNKTTNVQMHLAYLANTDQTRLLQLGATVLDPRRTDIYIALNIARQLYPHHAYFHTTGSRYLEVGLEAALYCGAHMFPSAGCRYLFQPGQAQAELKCRRTRAWLQTKPVVPRHGRRVPGHLQPRMQPP